MDDAHNKAPMVGKGLVTVCSPKASRAGEEKGLAGAWSSCCQHCWSQCWAKSSPGTRASKGRHQGWPLPSHAHQQPTQGGQEGSAQTLQPRSSRALHHPQCSQRVRSTSHTKEGVTAQLCSGPGAGCSGLCCPWGQVWDSGHSSGTAPGAALLWSCLWLLLCFLCSRQRL